MGYASSSLTAFSAVFVAVAFSQMSWQTSPAICSCVTSMVLLGLTPDRWRSGTSTSLSPLNLTYGISYSSGLDSGCAVDAQHRVADPAIRCREAVLIFDTARQDSRRSASVAVQQPAEREVRDRCLLHQCDNLPQTVLARRLIVPGLVDLHVDAQGVGLVESLTAQHHPVARDVHRIIDVHPLCGGGLIAW